ncbi:DUF2809 domain-containing protein [Agromyces salentinus]|uniref:DUF2809 domain-containing protein n=1 Tax=Agromyces salentinus TaxID=269421 RepID=A0ABP4YSL3_9MICO|nr:DUF2809 domain-containing protein [Agromyces salentinus]
MRARCAIAAVIVLLAGLGLQLLDRTVAIDLAGSALYACLVGLLVAIVRPGLSSAVIAVTGFAVSAAVELLQLTGLPGLLVDAVPPLRLVFGSSFDPLDLVGYAIGALLLFALHAAARRSSIAPRAASATTAGSDPAAD